MLVVPPIMFEPLWYWTMHMAGGWRVSLELEPEHRHEHLVELFLVDYFFLTAVVLFVSMFLLFLDGYPLQVIGCLHVIIYLLAPLGLAWVVFIVHCDFRFS
ncbi:MAG: hypothetical protein NVSMB9_16050 [Isosphaeraceae bacterium]